MAYSGNRPVQDPIKLLKEKIEQDFVGAYLFWGEEEYLKNYYREQLKDKIRQEGMAEFNLVSVSFEKGAALSDIAESLDVPPVMAAHKLVEVTGLDVLSLTAAEEKKLVEAVTSRADDTVLILSFYCDELDLSVKKVRERKIIKELSEQMMAVGFPRQSREKLLSWTDRIFTRESLHISDVSIGKMIDLCDYSMTRLKSESDKLVCRAKMEGIIEIPSDWIPLMVKPSAENETWELCEALIVRDKERTSTILENLFSQGFEPLVMFAAATKAIHALAAVKSAQESGIRGKEIVSVAGIFDWQSDRYQRAAYNRTLKGLKNSLEACDLCDIQLKGGSVNKKAAVTCLINTLLSEKCK
jgi:DNA polymerase-3 subunit delta